MTIEIGFYRSRNLLKLVSRKLSISSSSTFIPPSRTASTTSSARRFVLSHPSTVDNTKNSTTTATNEKTTRGRIICITSGKGGVGKTTTAASFGMGLAQQGFKTCLVDFDIGLRNLDIHLGLERRVIFDFVNVLLGECNLHQALIKHTKSSESSSSSLLYL